MVETTLSKHMICAVGCVHAGLPAKELFYRSGGLVTVNPIYRAYRGIRKNVDLA
ncbi:MAG: hypothetical protein II149_03130 [Clostridia bacterium]|nr:hypothetical protein [Clostridia bacterium]